MSEIEKGYNRRFKGIWIPKEIWLAKDLGWSEKLLLVEMDSLDGEQGCFASNDYLAEFFKLSKDRISKMVSSLRDKGYITVELQYKIGTKQIEKRIIRVVKHRYPIGENTDTYSQKQREGIFENTDTPIGENAKDNNTSFNNTFNKDDDDKEVPQKSEMNAFQFYEQNGFGTLSHYVAEKVGAWIDDIGEDLVIHAMKLALENNARTWKYIETILKNWSNKGLRTIEQVEAEQLSRKATKQQKEMQHIGSNQQGDSEYRKQVRSFIPNSSREFKEMRSRQGIQMPEL